MKKAILSLALMFFVMVLWMGILCCLAFAFGVISYEPYEPRLTEIPKLDPPSRPSAWMILAAECERYGIQDQACEMYAVLHRESRLDATVTQRGGGPAMGIAQFEPPTWEWAKRGSGLPDNASPYYAPDAIRAMAWVWSRPGGKKHWYKEGWAYAPSKK